MLKPPTLPFELEPFDQCRLRLRAALVPLWDTDSLAADVAAGKDPDRPGKHRTHVFDFERRGHRWRMIVSRERYHREVGTLPEAMCHLSCSMPEESPLFPADRNEALMWVLEDFMQLADLNEPPRPEWYGWSNHVMHLIFPMQQVEERNG